MKKYKLDIRQFLIQSNWGHPDFGVVAKFFANNEWYVYDSMLEEKIDSNES